MLKIVADDKIPFLRGVLEPYAELVYLSGAAIAPSDLRDADALITRTRTKCNEKLLAASSVRFIATATIGYDHIDTEYCAKHDIRWANAPGCNSGSVAQYLSSLLLNESIRTAVPLKDKVLGVIGVGNVGAKVAAIAEKFGMHVLYNDPPRERREGSIGFSSLERIMKEADYITLHTPLNRNSQDKTYHLGDDAFFRKLAKKPFFINSSRGEVVKTEALKSALITGCIRGAALDVWENEPDIDMELLNLLTYATPHIAGYSADGKANGTAMAVRALADFFGIPELKTFYPTEIPIPDQALLTLKSDRTAVSDAVLTSYNLKNDDFALRSAPELFERLRGEYPLRREFSAYTLSKDSKLSAENRQILMSLGFKTV